MSLDPAVISVVIVGPAAAGKSNLALKYTRDQFSEDYDPTIEDVFIRNVGAHRMEISDTAGVEMFSAVRHTAVASGEGFVVCIPTDRETDISETEMKSWWEEVIASMEARSRLPYTAIALCSTKLDLASDERRASSRQRGSAWAASLATRVGSARYFETSAKTGENVAKAFDWLRQEVLRLREPAAAPSKHSWCPFL